MNRRSQLFCAAALIAAVTVASQGGAQVKQGKTRPLTTKHLMSGLIKPQCSALGEALKGSGPTDDKAWDAAAGSASLLNEAGYVMMDDGRCPDATWAEACKTMRECSKTALDKIRAKDASGAREAFSAMTKACASCHAVHHRK